MMATRKYVFMRRDELGEARRAEGSDFLEKIHSFPDFNSDEDPAMWDAFLAWEESMNKRGQEEWEQMYGPESSVYLEETYESQFKRMGYGFGF